MSTIKIILAVIFGLIAAILIVALFVKKNFNVEKEIVINKPKQEVFDYIRLLRNQDNYSVWAERDPKMKRKFTGTDGAAGFISAWESDHKQVGMGEQEIIKITEGERIDTELRFIKPFKTQSDAYMITEAIDAGHTKVRWGFDGSFPYPFNALLLVMNMDKATGSDFSTGLSNLKALLEK